MRLSDIMGKADLASYAEVAVIIFFVVFMAIVIHTFRRSRKQEHDDAAKIPLDDDVPVHLREPDNGDRESEVTS